MDEEKTTEEDKPKDTTPAEDTGIKPKPTTLYEQTNAATERLEEANKKTEELLNRQEELYQRQQLGGRAEAGQAPVKPKEETDEELANKFDKGEVDILGK